MDILSAVVPERIRPYLAAILGSLVKQHWLTMKTAIRAEGSHHDSVRLATVKYTFSHPLLQRTLYDLTPASVRATMHLSIATVRTHASHFIRLVQYAIVCLFRSSFDTLVKILTLRFLPLRLKTSTSTIRTETIDSTSPRSRFVSNTATNYLF